ncbi:hypothetical protein RvY_06727 [Ramazzottius varieornatus]|uniref:C2H2-type domain-containing protein n=1 Tax=Ramazzottius varieornatus TaxID=947166 RepID=A0A1D1UZM4_RAMVA|nr:hypothetical protein RvY_06727 [Ramazzottius varieornatus]
MSQMFTPQPCSHCSHCSHCSWPGIQQQSTPRYGPAEPSTSYLAPSSAKHLPLAPPVPLIHLPSHPKKTTVIIDGSNVAMSHGHHKVFSWKGIDTCVKFFQQNGNPTYVVTPRWRKSCHTPAAKEENLRIIAALEEQGIMAWTPSRQIGSRMTASYDDPFILTYAQKTNGVIISNDYFRDVLKKCPQFREIIEERTLMFTFFEDAFYLPADQQGKYSKISTEALLNGTNDGWTGGMIPQAPLGSRDPTCSKTSLPALDSVPSTSSDVLEPYRKSRSPLKLKEKRLRRISKKKAKLNQCKAGTSEDTLTKLSESDTGRSKRKMKKKPKVGPSAESAVEPAVEAALEPAVVQDWGSSVDGWKNPFSVMPMSDAARRFLLTTKPEITTAISKPDGSMDWTCVLCLKKFREETFLMGHLDSSLHIQRLRETVAATENFFRNIVGRVVAAGTGLFSVHVNSPEPTKLAEEDAARVPDAVEPGEESADSV